jgi:ABC-type proline/glycine betaine transport system ATPase subunit
MKDGRFIQTGSAEQIVLTPADSYVAEFVRGVSRLKIVHARSLMRVLEPGEETRLDPTARVVDVGCRPRSDDTHRWRSAGTVAGCGS